MPRQDRGRPAVPCPARVPSVGQLPAGQPVLALPVDRGGLAASAVGAAHRSNYVAGPEAAALPPPDRLCAHRQECFLLLLPLRRRMAAPVSVSITAQSARIAATGFMARIESPPPVMGTGTFPRPGQPASSRQSRRPRVRLAGTRPIMRQTPPGLLLPPCLR